MRLLTVLHSMKKTFHKLNCFWFYFYRRKGVNRDQIFLNCIQILLMFPRRRLKPSEIKLALKQPLSFIFYFSSWKKFTDYIKEFNICLRCHGCFQSVRLAAYPGNLYKERISHEKGILNQNFTTKQIFFKYDHPRFYYNLFFFILIKR